MPGGCRLIDLLRRPQVGYGDLAPFDPARRACPPAVREQVEITVKYEGYIRRQEKQVEEFEKLERRRLPPDMDYSHIQGLRLEAREKLAALRPENLGQAGRISGVSPRRHSGPDGIPAHPRNAARRRDLNMTVIDLTHTIREDMPVYPGTEPPRLTTACTVFPVRLPGDPCCICIPTPAPTWTPPPT